MPPEWTPILTVADKLGVLVLGVAFVWALYTKRIVFGWVHTECMDELVRFRTSAEARLTRLEEADDRRKGR